MDTVQRYALYGAAQLHPNVAKPVTVSGGAGDDAKHYQERAVRRAIEESKT